VLFSFLFTIVENKVYVFLDMGSKDDGRNRSCNYYLFFCPLVQWKL
jgi:hypothetical protein